MSRLVLVGAGPFAREVHGWVRGCADFLRPGESIGFIDDDAESLEQFELLKTLYWGSVEDYRPRLDDRCLLCVASPSAKEGVVGRLVSRGASFATFVHSSVLLNDDVEIGSGSVVCPNVVLSHSARVGDYVSINLSSTVGHDAVVGDFCSIMSHVDVTGGVQLGQRVFVGSHATVLPGVEVGHDAVIGAGSAVIRRVPSATTVTGVPAQRIFGGRAKVKHAQGQIDGMPEDFDDT
jgi:sugar O-acyltransferase (sialic acid O-acetyltransferase NeuD family)